MCIRDSYNGFCAAGLDEDFGRTDNVPLGEGPYYAIEQGVCVIYTIGGLRTDAQSRVLDWDGEPIPRLYSCLLYTSTVAASGRARSLSSARTAARGHACQHTPETARQTMAASP